MEGGTPRLALYQGTGFGRAAAHGPQGLKPTPFSHPSSRLKPCPDTNPPEREKPCVIVSVLLPNHVRIQRGHPERILLDLRLFEFRFCSLGCRLAPRVAGGFRQDEGRGSSGGLL